MTERSAFLLAALLLVALAAGQMFAMHERHYRNRRWQLLESRLSALERIVVGDHE